MRRFDITLCKSRTGGTLDLYKSLRSSTITTIFQAPQSILEAQYDDGKGGDTGLDNSQYISCDDIKRPSFNVAGRGHENERALCYN